MSPERREIIAGALRSAAQLDPSGVGGAFAQVWSEWDNRESRRRIEEFINNICFRLIEVETEAERIKQRVAALPDFPKLLEDAIHAVERESDARKRALFPALFLHLIGDLELTADERSYALETLDWLTLADIEVLRAFSPQGYNQGDCLTNSMQGAWSSVGDEKALEAEYQEKLGPCMVSTAKLESRGLILEVPRMSEFHQSGSGTTWYNTYRHKAWKLMPIGRHLLRLIQ